MRVPRIRSQIFGGNLFRRVAKARARAGRALRAQGGTYAEALEDLTSLALTMFRRLAARRALSGRS